MCTEGQYKLGSGVLDVGGGAGGGAGTVSGGIQEVPEGASGGESDNLGCAGVGGSGSEAGRGRDARLYENLLWGRSDEDRGRGEESTGWWCSHFGPYQSIQVCV